MQKSKLQVKIQKFFVRSWPIFFILVIWIAFCFPYFFQAKAPFPSTYQVNHFHPWRLYEEFWGPVKNGAMPDIISQIYPWKHFTIESLKNGQIPLWNPYNFSGNPHLANFQTAVLSPFNLLYFVLPFLDAWSVIILLQPLLSFLFTYLLLREFGVTREGSILGATTFMFCGFMVVWMAYGTLSMAITFLPLALIAVERLYKKISAPTCILLSVSIAVSLFSGHFQTSLYLLLFVFLYILYKSFITKKWKDSFIICLYYIFGILLSLPQLFPSIEFYQHTVRSEIFIKDAGIPWQYLVTSFAPDFFGNPVTRNDWFGFYAEWSSFVGITPLILAFFAFNQKKNKTTLFFIFAGIISLLLAINSPLQNFLGTLKIPVMSTSTPSRIIVLFSFSFAILAGFGLDFLNDQITNRKIKRLTPILLAFTILLLLIWALVLVVKIFPQDKLTIARNNMIVPTGIFIIFLFIIIFARIVQKKWINSLLVFIIISFATLDSFIFASTWMPFDPRHLVFPQSQVVDALVQNTKGVKRVFGNLGAQVETYYGIPSIEGYDPLYIKEYGEFARSSGDGSYLEGERSAVRLSRNGDSLNRLIDATGVSFIYHPTGDTYQGWAYPVWDDKNRFTRIFEDSRTQIYRNNSVMSRAVLFYDYKVESDKKSIIEKFYNPQFDFRNTLLLEQEPGVKLSEKAEIQSKSVKIQSYSPNEIIAEVKTERPGLLYLSDNFYPGWNAYIDGKHSNIVRANYTFRAVPIDAGAHTVSFIYEPLSFKFGIGGFVVGLLGMLIIGIRLTKNKILPF